MFRTTVVTTAILCSVSATAPARAEDKASKPNAVERTVDRAAKFTEKTARRAGKFVEKTATRVGNFAEGTASKTDKTVRKALE
jgi:hypothetical protein